jgi:hypothetical protein
MAIEEGDDGVREVRLEGVRLWVVCGGLTLALLAAFMVGRWWERESRPPQFGRLGSGGAGDPLANVVEAEEPADVDGGADFFDTVQGGDKELEPQREVGEVGEVARARPQDDSPAGGAADAKPDNGPFYVQVFAGRDRSAAEAMVGRLQRASYDVRLFTERSGSDALYKVRVGGYATEDEARSEAQDLVKEGYGGAWVTRVD